MSQPKKTIDYLDLNIPILEKNLAAISTAIAAFEHQYDCMKIKPKVRDNTLLINSNDLIPFLGYLDSRNWSEIDSIRLKSNVRSSIEGLMAKTLQPDFHSHYQWCIAALQNFEFGRFLPDDKPSEDDEL